MIQKIIKKHIALAKRRRIGSFSGSSLLSLLTKPIWTHDKIKTWLGAPLVAAAIVGSSFSNTPSIDILNEWHVGDPLNQISGYQALLTTDSSWLVPVAKLTGISQGFHAGHPGIDFRAPLGTDIVVPERGVVAAILEENVGYGRHVYIAHEDGLVSLFAHMGKINVEIGETLKPGDKVGEVGLTGWTTGPHLHYELRGKEGEKINPFGYFSKNLSLSPSH